MQLKRTEGRANMTPPPVTIDHAIALIRRLNALNLHASVTVSFHGPQPPRIHLAGDIHDTRALKLLYPRIPEETTAAS
jgi:hypothetical protein